MGLLASIPSPSDGTIDIGPLHLRAYGLLIALGVLAAVQLASKRWVDRGGDEKVLGELAVWAVPAGVLGARAYHVATDYQRFRGNWWEAFAIWHGGLGIWGGIAGGTVVGLLVARRRGYDTMVLLDVVAPALPLAQAIGRFGNWFNQELFGRPTDLPWALRIDPSHRPERYADHATFHPTFLYESLWDLAVVGVVLLAERKLRLRPGRLFAVYVVAYTFGRFWVELLRIDSAHHVLGLRLNDWTSIVVFTAGLVVLLRGRDHDAPPQPEADVLSQHPFQAS